MNSVKVSVAEAKNRLTQLIQAVEKGEQVTICRHGKPVASLVSTDRNEARPRKFGTMADKKIVLDPEWAQAQNDVEAWLNGDV
jgi:prevent-host-death family protein